MSYTICISGERDTNYFYVLIQSLLLAHLKHNSNLHVIVGDCSGVDQNTIAICQEYKIPYVVYQAYWNLYGKMAGPLRNKQMIDTKPNLLLAFHRDISKSKGTKNTISLAKKSKIPIEVFS